MSDHEPPSPPRSRRPGPALRSTLQPLRKSRDFRLLWTGETISQVGSQITLVALYVQVFKLTHSLDCSGRSGSSSSSR